MPHLRKISVKSDGFLYSGEGAGEGGGGVEGRGGKEREGQKHPMMLNRYEKHLNFLT